MNSTFVTKLLFLSISTLALGLAAGGRQGRIIPGKRGCVGVQRRQIRPGRPAIAKKVAAKKPVTPVATYRGFSSGLTNIGNTCFINAMLQCTFASPTLMNYLNNLLLDTPRGDLHPISQGLQAIFQKYGKTLIIDRATMAPFDRELRNCFDDSTKTDGVQGDAGEAFMALFQQLNQQLPCENAPQIYTATYKKCSAEGCSSHGQPYQHVTDADNGIQDTAAIQLSVISEAPTNVSGLILHAEKFTMDPSRTCDVCGSTNTATSFMNNTIVPTGQYIAFTINRVNYDNDTKISRKMLTPIIINEEIIIDANNEHIANDLATKARISIDDAKKLINTAAEIADIPSTLASARYRLVAFADHTGGATGGHWYAYTKGVGLTSNTWERCDDGIITPHTPNFTIPSDKVALIVYERIDDEVTTAAAAATTTWPCSVCTYHNKIEDAICSECTSPKPREPEAVAASTTDTPGATTVTKNWDCAMCTYSNKPEEKNCTICTTARSAT